MPFGKMIDLINCYKIQNGIAKAKERFDDEEAIPDWE